MSDESENKAAPEESASTPGEPDLVALGDNDALLDALWNRTLEAWDDDKPHRAVLEHALKSEKLPDLAGRYRALKDDPEKGARAQKKIEGIVLAATQMMLATKTPARTKMPWQWSATIVFMCAVVILWLAWQLWPRRF
jgi:hypothetical protein